MGPNYIPGQKKDLYIKNVQRTVLCMGRRQDAVEDVPSGNTVAMVGLDTFIQKNATLTNEGNDDAHPIKVRTVRRFLFLVFRPNSTLGSEHGCKAGFTTPNHVKWGLIASLPNGQQCYQPP